MHRPLRLRIIVTAGAAALAAGGPARAQPPDEAVKAAFLPKFARYVDWPPRHRPSSETPLILCVIGADPYGRTLDRAAAGQEIAGNGVQVRRLATTDHAGSCHMAFVSGSADQTTSQMLMALKALPVLTVTDAARGPARGMIHFAIHDDRVGFHIDAAAAARSGLAISSRLLTLAISVRERP